PAIDHVKQSLGINSREHGPVLNNNNPFVQDQEAAERCTGADQLPAVSIKDVLPEQDQASLAERMAHTASQQLEIETCEIADADSQSLVEHRSEEHTSELQSRGQLVCRLLLEKKDKALLEHYMQ